MNPYWAGHRYIPESNVREFKNPTWLLIDFSMVRLSMYHVLEIDHDIYIHKHFDNDKTKCEISAAEILEKFRNVI